jgi:hypothetical protein
LRLLGGVHVIRCIVVLMVLEMVMLLLLLLV